jgi:hypothetical protein
MTDTELRELVREAIARHHQSGGSLSVRDPGAPAEPRSFHMHPSHGLLPMLRGADGDGACLIEPAVHCNHCGYCLSYGH